LSISGRFTHLDLKLSYDCNNNCIHCVVADQRERARALGRKGFRTTKEVIEEIVEAKHQGVQVVTFTGGEPTLRKDLPLLIRLARGEGLKVGIQTNGRLLVYDKVCDALSGMGVRFVVAIHGSCAEVHDAVTRAKGSFEQTIGGIRNLIKKGETVTAKVVISRKNLGDLQALAEKILWEGVRRLNLTFPHGLGNAGKDYLGVVPKLSEVMPELFRVFQTVERYGAEVVTEGIPLCLLGEYSRCASELYYGMAVSSIVKQLDQDARNWSKDRVEEEKAKPQRCKRCALNNRCEGVWKEYLEYFGDEELSAVL
jgi:MoaA/NifB/PqqE/SkfB family radical SAM enzyme